MGVAPSIIISLALAIPTRYGIISEDPISGVMPRVEKGYMNLAFDEQMTRSMTLARAMFAPPPTPRPLMAPTTGLGKSQKAMMRGTQKESEGSDRSFIMRRLAYSVAAASGTCSGPAPLSAAPEQKLRSPVAVQMSTFTSGSRAACSSTMKASVVRLRVSAWRVFSSLWAAMATPVAASSVYLMDCSS